jgi:hypothetical protein
VSSNLIEVQRLHVMGGAALAKYERLVGEADQSMHGSPAQEVLGAFCQAWIADPNAAMEAARNEAAAAAAAREATARAGT